MAPIFFCGLFIMTVAAGQRWASPTEPELGLGMITEVAARRVTVLFAAAEVRRVYALDNFPLTRVAFEKGETLEDRNNIIWTVLEQINNQGLLDYRVIDENGDTEVINELDLADKVDLASARQRLFNGQLDPAHWFALRHQALNDWSRHQQSSYRGLSGARINLAPHQYYVASEVASRHAPRILLADEVGLGKTIEAGLILHHQLTNNLIKRALIIVPDSLVNQWLVEMMRKFNLHFSLMDKLRCEAEGENPFEQIQLAITPMSMLTDEKYGQQIIDNTWDMLIVDEAHNIPWTPDQPSEAFNQLTRLCADTPSLLLLTATPEQLGIESHFARLRLLDPARFNDLEAFIAEEAKYPALGEVADQLLTHKNLSETQISSLNELFSDAPTQKLLSDYQAKPDETTSEPLLKHLVDCHGTGRVLFRNTRQQISGFPKRNPLPYPLELPEHYDNTHLQPEIHTEGSWWLTDPKVQWLLKHLKENKEKTLIICANASTASDISQYLLLNNGIACADFHEGLSIIERDRASAYFADETGARALICSEIGSEGRNFQFAQHLILFDLPDNPDLLEQRIGRLDRIGQQSEIFIHIPYYENSIQSLYYRWYQEGINAFTRTCSIGGTLKKSFADDLNLLIGNPDPAALDTLCDKTREATEALEKTLQQGRDRLLEINSYDALKAESMVNAIEDLEWTDCPDTFMQLFWDCIGVDYQLQSDDSVVLHLGEEMLIDNIPGLNEDGATVTFVRETALHREDWDYLTWDHPMVVGALDVLLNNVFGAASVLLISTEAIKKGELMLECLFRPVSQAPESLQVGRYLSSEGIRVLINTAGVDLSKHFSVDALGELRKKLPKTTAIDIIKSQREGLNTMLTLAQNKASEQFSATQNHAQTSMITHATSEIKRLNALKENNPNVRQEEIDWLQQQAKDLNQAIGESTMQLDAIRVVVNF
jgi:ATP-dependent helicase HepA